MTLSKTNSIVLLPLAAAAALGASALGSVVDSANGFVLRSNGSITLDGAVHAGGSLGALGSVTLGYGSSADGDVEMGNTRTWFTPEVGPWTSPGGARVDLGWSQSATLSAGNYGGFTSNSSTTLNLGSGTYTFTGFQLGWNSGVIADTSGGDVYIYVAGALTAADATRFQTTGPGRLVIVTGGNSSFGYQSSIAANIFSGGTLSFGGATQLSGTAFSAGNMSAGYGSNFAYVIPGPAALALLPIAFGARGSRRRRA